MHGSGAVNQEHILSSIIVKDPVGIRSSSTRSSTGTKNRVFLSGLFHKQCLRKYCAIRLVCRTRIHIEKLIYHTLFINIVFSICQISKVCIQTTVFEYI